MSQINIFKDEEKERISNKIDSQIEYLKFLKEKVANDEISPTSFKIKEALGESNELEKRANSSSVKNLKKDVEGWIDDWRNLFPSGVRSGGYLVKGDRQGCVNKMVSFIKKHGYTREIIYKATKDYVKRLERNGYRRMQLAHYFIEKHNNSTLAAECENILSFLGTEKEEESINIDRQTEEL